ncbi:MAG: DUF262 domain-containing protein [Myxococcota bacterium]
MNETQSQTESLVEIIKGVRSQTILLPEFQRDFRWDIERTYDLFDSLIREIFIGTIIYGKPAFEMTLRPLDLRPRKGKGARDAIQLLSYSGDELKRLAQTKNLRIVLDGQQRLTSLCRALLGKDQVFVVVRQGLDTARFSDYTLDELIEEVGGEDLPERVCVRLSDAWKTEEEGLEEDEQNQLFLNSALGKQYRNAPESLERKQHVKIYRRVIRRLIDLFKQQKLVAFYLLDMNLNKFCMFFERSNSRGIQLNFTDILAAKLYHGFNLRQKIEEFESESRMELNRELIIRTIAILWAEEQGKNPDIDKKAILELLDADTFTRHWDIVCNLYRQSVEYLIKQYYIPSLDWIPSENMLIPLMLFLRTIKAFERMSEHQRQFLEFWFWGSVFSNRYSGASNEVIILDCQALGQVAKEEPISQRGYFSKLRPLITEADDFFNYTKKSSTIYKGTLNLIGYACGGQKDWSNTQRLTTGMRLEDHHIYPRAYVASGVSLDLERDEASQLVDCVVNRTLIPKFTNITIGKKSPQQYLGELARKNPQLAESLKTHLVDPNLITDPTWNIHFNLFLQERAERIYGLVVTYVLDKAQVVIERYGSRADATVTQGLADRARLRDMLADGRVRAGDAVYVKKHP